MALKNQAAPFHKDGTIGKCQVQDRQNDTPMLENTKREARKPKAGT